MFWLGQFPITMAHAATDTAGLANECLAPQPALMRSAASTGADQKSAPQAIKKKRGPKAGRKAALMAAKAAAQALNPSQRINQGSEAHNWSLQNAGTTSNLTNDPYAFHCDQAATNSGSSYSSHWNFSGQQNHQVSLENDDWQHY